MNKVYVPTPERESYLKHRHDVKRQIILPVILVSVVGIGLGVLSAIGAIGASPNVGLWADISIIWLIIPMLFLALLITALLVGLIYGLSKLLNITPRYTGKVQTYILWLNVEIKLWADKITQPILGIKTWLDLLTKREGKNDR
ncbi:MAG: hypothetical protein WCK35_10410 [Chloroflexota bacterium]